MSSVISTVEMLVSPMSVVWFGSEWLEARGDGLALEEDIEAS